MYERTDTERLAVIEEILKRIEFAISSHIIEDKLLAQRVSKLEQNRAYLSGAFALVLIIEPIVLILLRVFFRL